MVTAGEGNQPINNNGFMKGDKTITFLCIGIALAAVVAAATGIFYKTGGSTYTYTSIRGNAVTIYGKGLYHHMSADVAIQGIAQDYVTLFIAVPLLVLSLLKARVGSLKWRYLLTGTTGYFLVTYLFYLVMGMYNSLFLVYTILAGTSFYLLLQLITTFDLAKLPHHFNKATPVKSAGGFLIFNAVCIALLWLGVVVPPLLDGSIIPEQVAHYTTLIVQGLDLAILLPAAFIIGGKLMKKQAIGYLWAPVYLVFLSLLMTALTAKIIAMALAGYNVIPAVFIIPILNGVSIFCATLLLKNIQS